MRNREMCVRIFIVNDSIAEGEETIWLTIMPDLQILGPSLADEIQFPGPIIINIRETCYDREVRLRGGFDEFQGRVEVCYNGEWGTVCHDGGWIDGGVRNSRVVCQQLGFTAPGMDNLVRCNTLSVNSLSSVHLRRQLQRD